VRNRISKEQIHEVAKRMFREEGYHGTTLEQIASELNVTRAALYYWVPSKEALLSEIHEEALDLLLERFEEVKRRDLSAIELLRAALQMHAHAVIENIDAVTSFFQDQASVPELQAERIRKKKAGYDHELEALIRQAQSDGAIRPELDPTALVNCLVGVGNWLCQWYDPSGRLSAAEIASQIEIILFSGVEMPAPRAS